MKIDDGFGDLEDEEPPEAALAAIENSGVDALIDSTRLEEEEIVDMPVIRLPRIEGGTGWDHQDACQVREQLTRYIAKGNRSIAIDFTEVLMVDKGAFGIFYDMVDSHGVSIYLLHPSPAAQDWYWFQMFAEDLGGGRFRIVKEALKPHKDVLLPGLFGHKSRKPENRAVNLET